MPADFIRPTGHLQVKGKRGSRAYYALVRDAEGRHQLKLGPAWVKDSGKRTPRGAVKWVARDGTAPEGYLTPAVAEDMLRELLAASPKQRAPASPPPRRTPLTLRQVCDAWLRSAEHETESEPSRV